MRTLTTLEISLQVKNSPTVLQAHSSGTLLAADSTANLTDPLYIIERWSKQFSTQLNQESTTADVLRNDSAWWSSAEEPPVRSDPDYVVK